MDSPEACQSAIDSFITTTQALNLPISPLPRSGTAAQSGQAEYASPTPVPRPDIAAHVYDVARLDVYAMDAADYLAHHEQEGLDGLRQWLESQHLICENRSCPTALVADNLDKDDALEYVVTLASPDSNPTLCASPLVPTWVYVLDCQLQGSSYCNIYRLDRSRDWDQRNSCVSAIADVNDDGQPEVLISKHNSGASDNFDGLDIVTWELSSYRFLNSGISAHNGCIVGRRQAGTNRMEFLAATSMVPGSAGMQAGLYPYPHEVWIYQWDGWQFAFAGRAFDLRCQTDVIMSGISWAGRGEIETALAFFKGALTDEAFPDDPLNRCGAPLERFPSSDYENFPWPAYAQFAIGVLQARMGRVNEARTALSQVRKMEDNKDIFSPAANVFLKAYENGSFASACEELLKYTDSLPDEAPFWGPYSGSRLWTLCPNELR